MGVVIFLPVVVISFQSLSSHIMVFKNAPTSSPIINDSGKGKTRLSFDLIVIKCLFFPLLFSLSPSVFLVSRILTWKILIIQFNSVINYIN